MTKKDIEKLARDLAKEVMKAAKNNPNLSYNEILHNYLQPYNDEVQNQLLEDISKTMTSAIPLGTVSIGAIPMSVPELSSRLYKNAQKTAKAATKVLNEYNATKSTINEMREVLYDGYGYSEMLPFKKDAPGFIQKVITPEKVARLKTKPLKAAYLDALDAKTDKAYAKALYHVVEEKSRYYALRIASTEEHKAYSLAKAAQLKDDNVEYVKISLSPSHKLFCICDGITEWNGTGYGAGVYKINDCPMPPYHPWCRCSVSEFIPRRRWTPVSKQDQLKRYSPKKQDTLKAYDRSKWNTPTIGEVFGY